MNNPPLFRILLISLTTSVISPIIRLKQQTATSYVSSGTPILDISALITLSSTGYLS
ncbi:hypothetical protein ECANGB1_2650 [Enterospora canceri]|uniref:Uncharacterized protein n=1 Tax=Enterospora canceri TaxID=1081671 RepID=A0A1Y1S785_9MICR|nr:hypothetical protein ECANGB1_2650 [Enterospora canceri]